MAYNKQNFQDGQILNAANLEAMENGIIAGQGAHNFLDNSDFTNPVNSRGKSSYSTNGNEYTIDRWKTQYGTGLTIENGYINIIGQWQIYQTIKNPKDGVYTFAAEIRINSIGDNQPNIYISDGTECLLDAPIGQWKTYILQCNLSSIESDNISFSLCARGGNNSNASISARWAAMYKGAYDASTLPPYVPKGKHVEMLNCGVSLQPHNLLDNSDFTNPVNQRGKTSYSGGEYAIDRWKLQADTNMNIMDGFIRITGSWDAQQILGNKLIGTYTYAICAKVNVAGEYTQTIEIYENGSTIATSFCTAVGEWKIYTCTATFTGANNITNPIVTINNRAGSISDASIDVKWAALYEGSYDASTLPAYVPKGKHVEMLNCNVPLAPCNLLDNSDFRNPVNQRGQTVYTGSAFTVDRWRTWNDSATITLTSDGIKGGGTDATVLYQGIELHKIKLGTAYTVAIGYSDSTISCATGTLTASSGVGIWNNEIQAFLLWNDGSPFMRLWHATKTIQWAAIYPGSYDASTLPPYQPKGYAAELAECRRYYVHCGEGNWMTGLFKVGEGLVVEIPAANNIRATYPTIIVNSPKVFTTNGWYDITYSSCSVTKCWTKLLFNFPEEANQFMSYYGVYIITGIVGVSADL